MVRLRHNISRLALALAACVVLVESFQSAALQPIRSEGTDPWIFSRNSVVSSVSRSSPPPNTQPQWWSGDDPHMATHIDVIEIHDLLLQRALQTQVWYYNEMRNEMMATWLRGFLNHTHLDSGVKWHSVVGMRTPFCDYLRKLLTEPPMAVTVRYKIGTSEDWPSVPSPPTATATPPVEKKKLTADEEAKAAYLARMEADSPFYMKPAAGGPTGAASVATSEKEEDCAETGSSTKLLEELDRAVARLKAKATPSVSKTPPTSAMQSAAPVSSPQLGLNGMPIHEDLKPWAAASASRRRNPYLNREPQYKEYEEVVQPQLIASTLMTVISNLAQEWQEDLALQFLDDDPEHQHDEIVARREAMHSKEEGDLSQPDVYARASRARVTESTPLRHLNFDLIQRSATIMAVKSLEAELAYMSRRDERCKQELKWLDEVSAPWWPRLSGVVQDGGSSSQWKVAVGKAVSDAMLEEISILSPIVRKGLLIDPPSMVDRIRAHRQKVVLKLGKQLEDTESILSSVRRESLERAMLERSAW